MLTFNYGSSYFWDKVVLTKFISVCRMVWDLICGTSWSYKSKTEKVTGGEKSAILPNWWCLRVSVQGVKSLGGHFACLCWGFDFYEVKKNLIIIFQKEKGNTFTLSIIFTVKSLQKEQNSTNLLLWPPICRNKHTISPKWINS
jgi:hypothetical protein